MGRRKNGASEDTPKVGHNSNLNNDEKIKLKALRHVIKIRSMEKNKRDDFDNAVDAYRHATGDFITTPLGQAMQPGAAAN